MAFLYFLEGLRNPVFDLFFSVITKLGEEILFLAIAIMVFWCVNKRAGYYAMVTGLVGTVLNQGLKLMFRIDRPWIVDTNFEPVGGSTGAATGYSFPSGHTQNIAGTLGTVCAFFKKTAVRIVSIVIIVLVAFSRMYLGVHTPLDVFVSLVVALVLVLGLYPFFTNEKRFNVAMPIIIGVCLALSVAFLIYVHMLNPAEFIGESHVKNLNSGIKNSYKLIGCMLGFCVIYPLDRFVIKFKTEARWYMQIVKLTLGLAIAIAFLFLAEAPIEAFFALFTDNLYIAKAFIYFILVVFAGSIWPLTFKFFGRVRIPLMEKFTEKLLSIFRKKQHAPALVAESDAEAEKNGVNN